MSETLTKEIVRNTPLRPGDRMQAEDLGEVVTVWAQNGLSDDALAYAQDLFESGSSLPNVDAGLEPPDRDIDPNLVSVTDCTVTSSSEIEVGGRVTVSAEVANGNSRAARVIARFEATNAEGAAETVVAAGRKSPVSVTFVLNSPGTYDFEAFIEEANPL